MKKKSKLIVITPVEGREEDTFHYLRAFIFGIGLRIGASEEKIEEVTRKGTEILRTYGYITVQQINNMFGFAGW